MILGIILLSMITFGLQFQYQKTYQPHTYYQVYLDDSVIGMIESEDELEQYVSKQGTLIKNQVMVYQDQLAILHQVDSMIEKLKKNDDKERYQLMIDYYHQLMSLVDENGQFEEKDHDTIMELVSFFAINELDVGENRFWNYEAIKKQIEDALQSQKQSLIEYIENNQTSLSLTETETYYLENYQKQQLGDISYIKQKYMEDYVKTNEVYLYADNVYNPVGIYVEKMNTYQANLSSVEEVYQKIVKEKPCTIEGYQFRIKKDNGTVSKYSIVGAYLLEDYETLTNTDSDDVIIFVTDKKVFEDAIRKLEAIFVGTEQLEKYNKGTQEEIVETGTRIDDVYVAEDITIKKTNISVGEQIYNDADELSSFLLYGGEKKEKTVYASATDNILSLTYKYGISTEEFFLSNPSFTSVNNLFYENQPIVIAETNPQISIVVEQYTVEDKDIDYVKIEEPDKNLNDGMRILSQKGVNGKSRVSQNVRRVNGAITYVKPVSTVVLKEPKNEITRVGTKIIDGVGSLSSWYWPTKSGYTLSSYYGWRPDPFGSGKRVLHSGLDIAGTGMGSPVYATNNGTIMTIKDDGKVGYGKHIIINHNNGYYSLYGHMSRFAEGIHEGVKVSRGQTIGYVGCTGACTGPHLHFEIRTCAGRNCVTNPLPYLRK